MKYYKKVLFVTLLVATSVFLFTTFTFAVNKSKKIPEVRGWQKEGLVTAFSNPFFNNIDIIQLDDGKFRAYFMFGGNIQSAISQDGKTFVLEDGIRIVGGHPAVVKLPDGKIRLYYASSIMSFTNNTRDILSAISTDGINFTQEEGVRLSPGNSNDLDSLGLIHLDVIDLPSGGYRIYYDAQKIGGEEPNFQGILSATSQDGLNFVKDPGIRVSTRSKNLNGFADLTWSPFIEFDGGLYKLYFSVEAEEIKKVGVYLAISEDGLNFKVFKRPIFKRDKDIGPPTVVDFGGLQGLPQDVVIINVPGGKRMFYWVASNNKAGTYSAFLPVTKQLD